MGILALDVDFTKSIFKNSVERKINVTNAEV